VLLDQRQNLQETFSIYKNIVFDSATKVSPILRGDAYDEAKVSGHNQWVIHRYNRIASPSNLPVYDRAFTQNQLTRVALSQVFLLQAVIIPKDEQ